MRIKNNNALSPVISAVLAAAVVASTIGAVILWGAPYIESLDSQSARENVESQMNVISGVVDSLISSDVGDKKTNVLAFSGGSISAGDDIDQTVVTYSHDPDFDFTVTDIRDDGVEINFISGDVEDISADMFFTNCFLSGTKVLMADGSYKNIEEIMIYDTIKSYDIDFGVPQDRSVTGLHNVEVTGSYIEIDQLRVTPDHKFYSAGNWIIADYINSGVLLFGFDGKEYIDYNVNERFDYSEQYDAYDLKIDGNFPYFVSIQDDIYVLVHSRESVNSPPSQPSNPQPANNSFNVPLDVVLEWSPCVDPDGDSVVYDIYFGTHFPPDLIMDNWAYAGYNVYRLEYNTDYYWKIVALDVHGAETRGPVWSFKTIVNIPSVRTEPATDIGQNTAKLHGMILDDGSDVCQVGFRYRLSGGAIVFPWVYLSDWSGSYRYGQSFYEVVGNLNPGSNYEFQAGAKNNGGEVWGNTISFKTNDGTYSPTVQTLNAKDINHTTATLKGKIINDGGENCQIRFRYRCKACEIDWIYPSDWHGSYNTNSIFQETVTGLNPGVDYEFQAGAKNNGGEDWDWVNTTYFKTTQDSITVISPNGGEIWLVNNSYDITWNSVGDVGDNIWIRLHVRDYYWELMEIAGQLPNTGFYSWEIPCDILDVVSSEYADQFIIEIFDGLNPTVSDLSNDFSIYPEGAGVFTLDATELTSGSARLNGNLVSISGQVRFRYRAFGSQNWIYLSYLPENYEAGESFYHTISGLSLGFNYEYQAGVKKLGFDELWGNSKYFKTLLHEGFPNQIPEDNINYTINGDSLQIDFLNPITQTFVIDLYRNGNCFLAGTQVLMADGSYKNIEYVIIGDMVKSYCEETGSISDKKVKNVFHRNSGYMAEYYIIINDGLEVTPNHRFYSDGSWVPAEQLKIGDNLFCIAGEEYTIYSLDYVYNKMPTFDLEIEDYHNYFVSITDDVDVLVHNNNQEYIGSIFRFRSNSMSHTRPSADKIEGYVFQKGGIIRYDGINEKASVKDARFIYSSDSFFSMNIIETNFSAFSTSTGSSNMINLRLFSDLKKSNIIGNPFVYNLRLQFFGEYSDSWIDYLNNNYNFDIDEENPSLKHPNGEGIYLSLTHSITNLEFQ